MPKLPDGTLKLVCRVEGLLPIHLICYKFSQLIRNKMIAKFRIKTAELIANNF